MKLNVEALSVAPKQPVSGQAAGPPPTKGSGDDAFRQMLQALMAAENKQTVPAAVGQTNAGIADWLAALLSTLRVSALTPDPTGEALPPNQSELAVPLTDLLAALQPMVNQSMAGLQAADPAAGAQGAASGEQSQSDTSAADSLLELAALSGVLAVSPSALPVTQTGGDANSLGGSQNRLASAAGVTGTSPSPVSLVQSANATARPANVADAMGAATAAVQLPDEGLPAAAAGLAGTPAPRPAAAVPAAVTADAAAAWLTAQAGAEPKVSNARPAISESLAAPAREGPKPELPVQTLASAAVPPAPVPGVALDTVSRPLPGLPDIPVLHQIARAVDVMQQGGGHEVRLQLQPPALGQLLVQLRVSGSDVSVHMLAETAQAQSVIRDHLPELKAALAAQGLQADKMAVTIGNHLSAFDMGYRQPEGWEQYQAYPAVTPVAETESVVERGAAPTPADNLHAVDYQV